MTIAARSIKAYFAATQQHYRRDIYQLGLIVVATKLMADVAECRILSP